MIQGQSVGTEFENYDVWDLSETEIPPRAVLYNLAPAGIGTTEVESLSGYISRLAQEHYLSPVVLLKSSAGDLSELPKILLQNSINSVFAGGLNGFGASAESIVQILEKATYRSDIRQTTLLSLKGRLSNQKLLKKHLSWCPLCFEEAKSERRVVYDKLIWSIEKVKACHIHEIPLQETCPRCHKQLKVLSGRSRPGYCSKCLSWLGSEISGFDELNRFSSKEEKDMEIWKSLAVGELLCKSSSFFISEKSDVFVANLHTLIRKTSDGSINDFAYRTGMWHISVRRLLKGTVLPTSEMILKICFPFKLSPVELFENNEQSDFKESKPVKSEYKELAKQEMAFHLPAFLSESPPLSANEVSRRSGWTTTRLQRHFPKEYRLIVEQYQDSIKKKLSLYSDEEVEKILIEASREKPPPSLQAIFRRIGCQNTGYRYYQRFPELCTKISEQYEKANNKRFDTEKAEKVIRSALVENPPPSYSEVARRIKCSRTTLEKQFPELSKILHKNYSDYLTKSKKENKKELYEAIEKAVRKIQKTNSHLSENQVRKHLPRKWNDKVFKKAYIQILSELNLNFKE